MMYPPFRSWEGGNCGAFLVSNRSQPSTCSWLPTSSNWSWLFPCKRQHVQFAALHILQKGAPPLPMERFLSLWRFTSLLKLQFYQPFAAVGFSAWHSVLLPSAAKSTELCLTACCLSGGERFRELKWTKQLFCLAFLNQWGRGVYPPPRPKSFLDDINSTPWWIVQKEASNCRLQQ